MLAMNNEGFPLFKRTCSAQISSMACFPGLGPRGAPPLGAQEVAPEWVSNSVYLLLAVLQ